MCPSYSTCAIAIAGRFSTRFKEGRQAQKKADLIWKIFFFLKLFFEVHKTLIKKVGKKRKIIVMNTNIFGEERMSPLRENFIPLTQLIF